MKIQLPIVGSRKLSLSDYPGNLCATVTVPGCNFRCPFCPNSELIHDYIPMEKTLVPDFLEMIFPRRGFLDAVTITGGEPLLHRHLQDFLGEIKNMGYKVKLDTNASRPKALQHLIDRKLVDYLSVQLVAPFQKTQEVARYRIKPEMIREAVQIVRRSGVHHEFKVTPIPGINEPSDIDEIVSSLSGSRRLVIKRFRPEDSMDKECRAIKPYSEKELEDMRRLAAPYFNEAVLEP
ncbi:MAG: anaerobic ribonucleoside-triphosphate reductase activating protein [Candidatus Bathyarchaeota archaeon]|nr:anaerobic ribonucleoside-triphosphate reductase activating protein [Candidatus Bathyarchaeota archaeon]